MTREGEGSMKRARSEGLVKRARKIHEQSTQEMLRKARQQQQHNSKAKQHKTTCPKQSFSKKNSGGVYVHVCMHHIRHFNL